MPTIVLSPFARGRHQPRSRYSHFEFEEEELLRRVQQSFPYRVDGYRDGVLEVPVDPSGFFSATVTLQEGDKLVGTYQPRQPGELPRKHVGVLGGTKTPARSVVIILYRHDVLAENNEHSCDAEWEIISINASATDEPEPMTVGTLLANHFHEEGSNDGGTSTHMTDAELVAALKKSFLFWRNKATITPR